MGRAFVDAFNRRDADALVACVDPAVDFRPTSLVGARRAYRGRDGIRRWFAEFEGAGDARRLHARVREIRPLDEHRFLLLSEVLVDGRRLSPSAMLARLNDRGEIAEARAYLSDEELLTQLGFVPEPSTTAASGETPRTGALRGRGG